MEVFSLTVYAAQCIRLNLTPSWITVYHIRAEFQNNSFMFRTRIPILTLTSWLWPRFYWKTNFIYVVFFLVYLNYLKGTSPRDQLSFYLWSIWDNVNTIHSGRFGTCWCPEWKTVKVVNFFWTQNWLVAFKAKFWTVIFCEWIRLINQWPFLRGKINLFWAVVRECGSALWLADKACYINSDRVPRTFWFNQISMRTLTCR